MFLLEIHNPSCHTFSRYRRQKMSKWLKFLNSSQGFRSGFILPFKGLEGGLQRTPIMISGTIQASPMKCCTAIVLLKTYQNTKRNLSSDVTMTSFLKQWENWDLCEYRQIIYHLKGNDKSFLKI